MWYVELMCENLKEKLSKYPWKGEKYHPDILILTSSYPHPHPLQKKNQGTEHFKNLIEVQVFSLFKILHEFK